MRERDYGRIVNIGAIQSYSPLPGAAAYAATKAGLEGMTRSLATEWSANGVTVNTIHVGPVYGSDWTDSPPGADAPVEQRYETVPEEDDDEAATLVGRLGRPSDVAALVAFLSAPESGFLTGTVVPCDGGRLISRAPEPFDQEETI
jgi:NAD(P)-dependent dehydrogenase (short-subunit alcohol dehydrogenase family)